MTEQDVKKVLGGLVSWALDNGYADSVVGLAEEAQSFSQGLDHIKLDEITGLLDRVMVDKAYKGQNGARN